MSYMEVLMHDRAINALYDFVCLYREYPILRQDPEYDSAQAKTDQLKSDLEEALTKEQRDLLERYLTAKVVSDDADFRALFTCGVSVGMELAFCGQL